MSTTLRVSVLTGPHKGEKFCFRGRVQCLIGRGPDCFIQLTGTERDRLVSRRHCQLDLDPAALQVKDLGSQNGTYLNGKKIELAELRMPESANCPQDCECAHDLSKLNLLTIGGTTLRIDVVDCALGSSPGPEGVTWEETEAANKNCPVRCPV